MASSKLMSQADLKQSISDLNSAFGDYAFNEDTRQTIINGQRALNKLMEWAAEFDFKESKPCETCGRKGMKLEDAGKTAAYIQKVVGEAVQLTEKAQAATRLRNEKKGNLADLLQYLNDEQFQIVSGWIDAARNG